MKLMETYYHYSLQLMKYFDISLKEVDGEPGMFFNNKSLIQFLKDWQAMKELLASGSQTADNYEIWKTIRPSVTKVVHED